LPLISHSTNVAGTFSSTSPSSISCTPVEYRKLRGQLSTLFPQNLHQQGHPVER
jgi:hypothetical protein